MKKLLLLSPFILSLTVMLTGCGSNNAGTPEAGGGDSSTTAAETDPAAPDTDGGPSDGETAEAAAQDIVDTAIAAEGFSTLVAAVQAADLVETLKGEGPFTVFAPTDEAFGKLPEGTLDELLKPENKEKLAGILTFHVVPGKVMAADVVELTSAKTAQGGEVKISAADGKVQVNGANVVSTDIECANGVIHVIDAVILPE